MSPTESNFLEYYEFSSWISPPSPPPLSNVLLGHRKYSEQFTSIFKTILALACDKLMH